MAPAKASKATGKAARKAPAPPRSRRAAHIRSWQDDPGGPDSGFKPVESAVPQLDKKPLAVGIAGRAPGPGLYSPGTSEFRYWVAAEALRRGADLWSTTVPELSWFSSVGPRLDADLDHGEDLNAYYDRQGLRFFHGSAGSRVVFSAESPDVVCHELGHAVLDALQPQLFDANFIETAAFHESFGDMSAILSALQLRSVRQDVLVETGGDLHRSSRLSRLAEQLGWAIRLRAPDAVEPDCLRNAVNSFFYSNPAGLPPSGPSRVLCSEPHSFSRLFTAAFLESLAGAARLVSPTDEAGLLQTSRDMATLLAEAIVASPVVPDYYSQVAAHVLEADAARFGGKHGEVLRNAFVKHGILSLDSANTLSFASAAAEPPRRLSAVAAITEAAPTLHLIALPGHRYGLPEDLLVPALAETKRFGVAGAAPDVGSAESSSHDRAAQSFVEDLFRRGKVDATTAVAPKGAAPRPSTHSHELRKDDRGLVLTRRLFDCWV